MVGLGHKFFGSESDAYWVGIRSRVSRSLQRCTGHNWDSGMGVP